MESRHMFKSTRQHRAVLNIHKRAAAACKNGPDSDVVMAIVRNVLAVVLVVSLFIMVVKL